MGINFVIKNNAQDKERKHGGFNTEEINKYLN